MWATMRVVEGVSCSSRHWQRVLETIILDLARVAAGSEGVREMVNVVEESEEEIKMEDEHDDEEEARGVWMILLFCAILVMAYSESAEVQLLW